MWADRHDRWALVAGAALVFALRLMLTLADPDVVHPVDPAELAHLHVWTALADGRLAWLLGADANVHHGGFFWLGLPVGFLRAVTGSDLLAVRGVAAALAATGWAVWVGVAHRLGGRVAAVGAGLCLAIPTPWFAQWTATLWGSHSEATVWTGLWALALASSWRPATLGVLLGLGVAWDPLLWPVALLAGALSASRGTLAGALGLAWVGLRAPVLWADPAGLWATSLSEDPAHSVGGLLARTTDWTLITATLSTHVPLPWVATGVVGGSTLVVDAGLTVVALTAGVLWVVRRRDRVSSFLVVAPWLQLVVIVLWSPTRPGLAHRYLVAWWPALVVVPWLLGGRERGLAAGPVLASVLALPLLPGVLSHVQPEVLWSYPSARFQALGLDRVPVARSEGVVAFLDHRPDGATAGFAAAFSERWGYPVWGEDYPDQVRAPGLPRRLADARATGAVEQVDRDLGFGLVVVCDGDRACVEQGVSGLELAGVDPGRVWDGAHEAWRAVQE